MLQKIHIPLGLLYSKILGITLVGNITVFMQILLLRPLGPTSQMN